jgi:hypothetical protein
MTICPEGAASQTPLKLVPFPPDPHFKVGSLGLPVLKSTGKKMSVNEYQKLIERIQEEEDDHIPT